MKNLNKIILAIEESILAHISDEDVSVTKVSQLSDRLMKFYEYRDKKEKEERAENPIIVVGPAAKEKKKAPVKDASKDMNLKPEKV